MLHHKVLLQLTNMTSQYYVIIVMICGNTSDFIDHPLPKLFVSAHGVSHQAWAPGPPPSKSGAVQEVKQSEQNKAQRDLFDTRKTNSRNCEKVYTS